MLDCTEAQLWDPYNLPVASAESKWARLRLGRQSQIVRSAMKKYGKKCHRDNYVRLSIPTINARDHQLWKKSYGTVNFYLIHEVQGMQLLLAYVSMFVRCRPT